MRRFFLFLLTTASLLSAELPFVRGSAFRELADHRYDSIQRLENGASVKEGDIIFVKSDLVHEFRQNILPTISERFILITHNSDAASPGENRDLLEDDRLIHWFGQNPDDTHVKFTAIPIGIANEIDSWGRVIQHGKGEHLLHICEEIPEDHEPTKLLYVNFLVSNNPEKRLPVYQYFQKQTFCKIAKKRPYLSYLAEMADYKFSLSPEGNGLDCHRIWECLYVGVIPVMLHSPLDTLLEGLPVLLIDDWKEITEAMLSEQYEKLKVGTYDLDKIYWSYWKEHIVSMQQENRGE